MLKARLVDVFRHKIGELENRPDGNDTGYTCAENIAPFEFLEEA